MELFMGLLTIIVAAIGAAIMCMPYTHMLQLESYQIDGFFRWLKANKIRKFDLTPREFLYYFALDIPIGILLLNLSGTIKFIELLWLILIAKNCYFVIVKMRVYFATGHKKPLVFTPRVRRLYAIIGILCLFISAILWFIGVPLYSMFIAPLIVVASAYVAQPIETAINNSYLSDAKEKLEASNVIKIGITGSYGKTSTKFVLGTLLSEKYKVLVPPSSFNTPMGLTRVIREQLDATHQVFLAEMGARHIGDIKQLVNLVQPQFAVLTSVGPQHLETFGNIETVASTKNELIEGLPEDGEGFFSSDGGWVDKLYKQAKCKKYLTGLTGDNLYMTASDIIVGEFGSRFTLIHANGESVQCETQLLGKHNIQNIVLCSSVAYRLGLSLAQIAIGIKKVEPVEHRLQLIKGNGGVTVIDDAFNSNPAGAAAAMEVLGAFQTRRIVVTPGMVELGEREYELNMELGKQMAVNCDIAILIGKKRSQAMVEGLKRLGFDEANLYVVASLTEATVLLGTLTKASDVVLFENDLPDNYSE